MSGIRRLNHAVLFVNDVAVASSFYQDVLGFRMVSTEFDGRAVFLRAEGSENHHDLGLFHAPGSRPATGTTAGLYHLAWQVGTVDELARFARVLTAAGALRGASDHGATLSLYGVDPSGNEFEVQWMLPREAWGEFAERGVVRPLDLEGAVERWSGVSTADTVGA